MGVHPDLRISTAAAGIVQVKAPLGPACKKKKRERGALWEGSHPIGHFLPTPSFWGHWRAFVKKVSLPFRFTFLNPVYIMVGDVMQVWKTPWRCFEIKRGGGAWIKTLGCLETIPLEKYNLS